MVYFEGDSSTVDGPKFKAALGSAVIALGVSPDGIVSINLQVGSIIAEINLVGMEFGRMINEAMENRLLVVLVDGAAFVGYATYAEIDPFFDQVCEGYHLGNMTFPLADFPSPQQLDGFVERGAIVPSERHMFQTELNTKVQLVATAQYREDGFKPVICVVATIVEVDSRSVLVDIIVSRASPEFDQFDQAFYDRLSEAIAIGYTSGDLNVQVGDTVVSAQDVDLNSIEAAFFAEDKEASSNAALIGAVVAVLAITVILIGLAYWAKRRNENQHWAEVSARVQRSRSANLFHPWTESGDHAGNGHASVLEQFGLGPDMDAGFGMSMVGGRGSFTKSAEYRPASAQSALQGYFNVGDIRAPSTLPGPASPGGHFYPGGMGTTLMGQFGAGSSTSPTAAYGSGSGRISTASVGDYRDPNPADDEYIVTGQLLNDFGVNMLGSGQGGDGYRPALFDEDEDDDDGMGEWGTHAWGTSPEPPEHDFPTMRSATITKGGGLPGYAAPEEPGIIEVTQVEALAVHFAHENGAGAGRPSLFEDDDDDDDDDDDGAEKEFGIAHIALTRPGGSPLSPIIENN